MPYKSKEKRKTYERARIKHNSERGLRSKLWREKCFGVKYPEVTNCQMCDKEISGSDIELDHDHSTGLFRGWLCTGCNVALGQYERIKEAAEKYLNA